MPPRIKRQRDEESEERQVTREPPTSDLCAKVDKLLQTLTTITAEKSTLQQDKATLTAEKAALIRERDALRNDIVELKKQFGDQLTAISRGVWFSAFGTDKSIRAIADAWYCRPADVQKSMAAAFCDCHRIKGATAIKHENNTLVVTSSDGSKSSHDVHDVIIQIVALHCWDTLTHVDVNYSAGKIHDAAILTVAQQCSRLSQLDAYSTKGSITDASITQVAQLCPTLTSLSIGNAAGKITDVSIMLVAQNCPQLSWLQVSDTEGKITDISISLVAQHCKNLSNLYVHNTNGAITDVSITLVAQKCQKLLMLWADNTGGKITAASLDLIRAKTDPKVEIKGA